MRRFNWLGFLVLLPFCAAASVGHAQQLDIHKDSFDSAYGIENTGRAWTQPQIILNPSGTPQFQPQTDYGDIAKKVLEGNPTPTEEQLKDRLEKYMKPAFSPGTVVLLAPSGVPTYGSVEFGPRSLQMIPDTSTSSAETAAISTDVVAFVNRAGGVFQFRLRIGAVGTNKKLLANEFRTYDCLGDCLNGALVEFDPAVSAVPGEVKVKGGEIYSVNYTDAGGWTVTKVDKISYLLPQ